MKTASNKAKHKYESSNSPRQLEKKRKWTSKFHPRTTIHGLPSLLTTADSPSPQLRVHKKRKKTNRGKFRGVEFQDFHPHLAKRIARD